LWPSLAAEEMNDVSILFGERGSNRSRRCLYRRTSSLGGEGTIPHGERPTRRAAGTPLGGESDAKQINKQIRREEKSLMATNKIELSTSGFAS
jgi:hypothetical protein